MTSMFNLICEECSQHFESERQSAKFCKDECRLKNWRSKKALTKKVYHSTCPNCWDDFAHKNPKKEFCSPKCKTAFHRKQANEQEKQDRYFNAHNYFAPLTPEEQVNKMLSNALREQELEDI